MHGSTTLVWGIALLLVGLFGLAVVSFFPPGPTSAPWPTLSASAFTSDGQRIYYTGTDATGRVIPRSLPRGRAMGPGMMGEVSCVDCHGEDGRGGRIGPMMVAGVEVPDIRYSVLTAPHSEEGTTLPAWSETDIKRAIRDGVEPDGQQLKPPMPRWDMTDRELTDTISYLKELDSK